MIELGSAKTILLLALGAIGVAYVAVLFIGIQRRRAETPDVPTAPTAGGVSTGFVTNFFDTLGIGSYAPTTSIFRAWKMVPDEQIPGTLNIGHTLPTIIQAIIFTRAVPVFDGSAKSQSFSPTSAP